MLFKLYFMLIFTPWSVSSQTTHRNEFRCYKIVRGYATAPSSCTSLFSELLKSAILYLLR